MAIPIYDRCKHVQTETPDVSASVLSRLHTNLSVYDICVLRPVSNGTHLPGLTLTHLGSLSSFNSELCSWTIAQHHLPPQIIHMEYLVANAVRQQLPSAVSPLTSLDSATYSCKDPMFRLTQSYQMQSTFTWSYYPWQHFRQCISYLRS